MIFNVCYIISLYILQFSSAQAFPGATSMAYADNISEKEKIIIPSKNGLFVTPEGGWFKQRRTFHVVKGMLLIIIFDI